MEYKDLRKLFHISGEAAQSAYEERFSSPDALHFDFSVSGHPAFCVVNTEIYRAILQAERLSREIDSISGRLPGKAVDQYLINCLIDEIVLTNDIEGVISTRQEIGGVLEKLKNNDRTGRFHGIVEKYLALRDASEISLSTCEDIRSIYDELVLDEVVAADGKNRPDGKVFRAGPVSVLDAGGRPIHRGLEPESRLIDIMSAALGILGDESLEVLVRASLFHFVFAYAHPFYDGNGRTNRFISSYVLAKHFNPLVGLRLSYSVKKRIEKYYKGFSLCEHPLNRGDLTPFVLVFSEIIVEAMQSMRNSLSEKLSALGAYERQIRFIPDVNEGKDSVRRDLFACASLLIQAALFSDSGITAKEAAELLGVSLPTLYQRLKFFGDKGLTRRRQVGHSVRYSMDLQAFECVCAGAE